MALGLYKFENDEFTAISSGDLDNPAVFSLNSSSGGSLAKKFYLKNSDENAFYSGISLKTSPDNLVGPNNIKKFKFKLLNQDAQPTDANWNSIETGNTITFSDVGTEEAADLTYHPFWLQITIPPKNPLAVYTNLSFELTYTAGAVSP